LLKKSPCNSSSVSVILNLSHGFFPPRFCISSHLYYNRGNESVAHYPFTQLYGLNQNYFTNLHS